MTRNSLLAAIAVAVVLSASGAHAQFDPINAPSDAMDTLNSAPVGSAGGSFDPIGRARGAVGAANAAPGAAAADPFGAPPAGFAPGANPFGGPPPGFAAGGANPFGGPPGGFSAPAIKAPKVTNTAWAGERIIKVNGGVPDGLLQDAREIKILPEFAGTSGGRYYDDGKTGNDAVAGDSTFTNITISSGEYISPEEQAIKSKLIQTLDYMSRLDPMDFFHVPVATSEPLSSLPKEIELEKKMDDTLRKWIVQLLTPYQRKTETGETFIPAYLPPPPRAPEVPLPSNFAPKDPPENTTDANGNNVAGGAAGTKGGEAGGDVTGEPIGNASSRYF